MHPYRQGMEETDVSDSSDAEERERLGDKVFSLVKELDPIHANDITGKLTHQICGIFSELLFKFVHSHLCVCV